MEVADKFLYELEKAKKLDLRISGRVLLYAAILVRMKSDIIANEIFHFTDTNDSIGEDFEGFDSEFDDKVEGDFDLKNGHETYNNSQYEREEDKFIKNLVLFPKKRVRRYTTLKDLIEELEKAERVRKRRKGTKFVLQDPFKVQHEERLEKRIIEIEKILFKIFKKKGVVKLSEIRGDKVENYISILHLAFRKKVLISQEKVFESDIEIRRIE